MKICKHEWEFSGTIDRELPFGDIISTAMFKCKICGKEVDEYELKNNNTSRA